MASKEDGFSLTEVLVALAVFSLTGVALLNVMQTNTRSIRIVEERTWGRIVAENHMVEALTAVKSPSPGVTAGTEKLAGIDWDWQRKIAKTGVNDFDRIDIEVRRPETDDLVATVSGFRGAK